MKLYLIITSRTVYLCGRNPDGTIESIIGIPWSELDKMNA